MKRRPASDRLLAKRIIDEEGCWIYPGTRSDGYRMIRDDSGRDSYVHRLAYELFVGPIPEGLTIDHLCRKRACFRPACLEAVTVSVNILRGTAPPAMNAAKTHCKRGHELSGQNLRLVAGGRDCWECRRAWDREAKRRQRRAA